MPKTKTDAEIFLDGEDPGECSGRGPAFPGAKGDIEGHPFHGNQWTGGGGDSPKEVWQAAQEKAIEKAAAAPTPTQEQYDKNRALIDSRGNQQAHMLTRGNSTDRANSRAKLLNEFGDGKTAPCTWCGKELQDGTVTRDHIVPFSQGGTFQYSNLIPACGPCNSSRGDTPFDVAMGLV